MAKKQENVKFEKKNVGRTDSWFYQNNLVHESLFFSKLGGIYAKGIATFSGINISDGHVFDGRFYN